MRAITLLQVVSPSDGSPLPHLQEWHPRALKDGPTGDIPHVMGAHILVRMPDTCTLAARRLVPAAMVKMASRRVKVLCRGLPPDQQWRSHLLQCADDRNRLAAGARGHCIHLRHTDLRLRGLRLSRVVQADRAVHDHVIVLHAEATQAVAHWLPVTGLVLILLKPISRARTYTHLCVIVREAKDGARRVVVAVITTAAALTERIRPLPRRFEAVKLQARTLELAGQRDEELRLDAVPNEQ